MKEPRQFKGIWIPKEIWLDPYFRKNPLQRDLLMEIFYFDNDFGCKVSNGYFAEIFGCAKQAISSAIQKLKDRGHISVSYSNESTHEGRVIKVIDRRLNPEVEGGKSEVEGGKSEVEGGKSEVEGGKSEVEHNKTFNNTPNTTPNTPPPTTPSAELSDVSSANAKAFAKREICDAPSFKGINTDSDAKQNECVPNQHALSTTSPPVPPPPPPPESQPVVESQPSTDPFDEFWSLYPRKIDKKKASAKYKKLVKHHTIIMEGLRKHLELWKKRDIEYIPHPTTWLHGERWNDELPPPKPQQQTHTPNQTPTTPNREHKPEPEETLSSVFESSIFTKKSDEEKREFLEKYRERGCEIPSNLSYLLV